MIPHIIDKEIPIEIKCKFDPTPQMKAYGLSTRKAPLILSVVHLMNLNCQLHVPATLPLKKRVLNTHW